jgi:ascorbate PTS system EIIA or EIIAB component
MKRTSFRQSCPNWKEAIVASCQPLIEQNAIDERYIKAVISCVEKYGPYIVLAPNIAMPHSTEGCEGVNETAISFMKVEEPVVFEEGNPDKNAKLFFVLASCDHEEHMKNMVEIANLLTNPDTVEDLLQCKCDEDLIRVHNKYFKL